VFDLAKGRRASVEGGREGGSDFFFFFSVVVEAVTVVISHPIPNSSNLPSPLSAARAAVVAVDKRLTKLIGWADGGAVTWENVRTNTSGVKYGECSGQLCFGLRVVVVVVMVGWCVV